MTENSKLKSDASHQLQVQKGVEKERDFYYGKLRDIELLLLHQRKDTQHALKAIEKVLFAKEDDDLEVDEEGKLVVD